MTHTPAIALHPVDAAAASITDGGLARLRTEHGQIVLRAELRYGQRRGEAFAPMHWTDAFTATGPIDWVDPVSGQPELKATPATVEPVTATFHGLLLQRSGGVPVADLWRDLCHWVRIPVTEGELYRLSGLRPMPSGEALSRFAAALTQQPAEADTLEMADSCRGVLRVAVVMNGTVEASLFLARAPSVLPVE